MSELRIAPYGAWTSPITSDLIVSATVHIGGAVLDEGAVYWLEGRPTEGGRYVIVKRMPDGSTADLNPAPTNARTRVHEYGGGAEIICDGTVYFSNFSDQRLYRTAGMRMASWIGVETASSACVRITARQRRSTTMVSQSTPSRRYRLPTAPINKSSWRAMASMPLRSSARTAAGWHGLGRMRALGCRYR